MQYMGFLDRLLSPGGTRLTFPFLFVGSSLPFSVESFPSECAVICLPTGGHPGCIKAWAVTDQAFVNIGVCVIARDEG